MKKSIGLLIIVLSFVRLSAQRELAFTYYYADKFNPSAYVQVILASPVEEIKLYSGWSESFEFRSDDYLQIEGNYTLKVKIERGAYRDSLLYDFNIGRKETGVEISLTVRSDPGYFDRKFRRKREIVSKVYLSLIRYSEARNVEISLAEVETSKKPGSLQGPFFEVKNNSKDTIYGRYHPDYLWGELWSMERDSAWHIRAARIDVDFPPSLPLYPGSTSLATVGSFGYSNTLPARRYRYELLYTTVKENAYSGYKRNEIFSWNVADIKYYKLVYEFEKK